MTSETHGIDRTIGYAYPWDVIGDPGFVDRVAEHGITEVTLAATYHSARAATPMHPRHQLVTARHAALYRPVREDVWGDWRLRPVTAHWVDAEDPFGEACAVLRDAGLSVTAWIVLTHNTRLGETHPDIAVVNCFGDAYPYALCPSEPEVRDYASCLATEAVRDVELAGISLEACGQLGIAHIGHHEKTDAAWSPAAARLLSICCCECCQQSWRVAGLDSKEVVERLCSAVTGLADTAGEDVPPEELLGTDLAGAVLAARHGAADALRTQVLDALRRSDHAEARFTLHGQADPWATGPSPGLTESAASDVDSVLVPCWPTVPATAQAVARTKAAVPDNVSVGAYVTVLPPADPAGLDAHVRRVAEAGASELHLYHLGLAPPPRQRLIRQLADLATELKEIH